MRALFLSANVGAGHTSAANALRAALVREDVRLEARVVDSYKYAASVVSHVVSNGYLGMVKTIPQMYRFLYNRAERATEVGPFRTWIHQFTAGNLRQLLVETRPHVVICTHAFPCGVMAEYKKLFADAPPVFAVVTDFVVHAFWIHPNIDMYAVATPEMRATLVSRGVPSECIMVSGIPVDPAFGEFDVDRNAIRERLGLPCDRSTVLLMGGGLGLGPLEKMMEALDRVGHPLCAVLIVGRSARSRQRVLEQAHRVRYPVRVVPFVTNVHDYMHAVDLLITKPGGMTASEALAARVPTILFKPLPGQEERNTRYLVQQRAALRAKAPADLTRNVEQLLDNGDRRAQMRAAMRAIAKPAAAAEIASAICAIATGSVTEAIA